MGTWSKPLFATVSGADGAAGSPDDYVIDTSVMTEQEMERWRNTAFLEDAGKTRWTLNEFMNTGCDTHKIIDHMGYDQVVRWEKLFRQLYAAYPTMTRLAFHFFCIDGRFPYYLTMDREADSKLLLFYGHSESLMYFRPRRRSWFNHGFCGAAATDEEGPEFMPEWYRRGFSEGTLDMRVIRLDSSRIVMRMGW